jgi:Zn-dependent peptidase ImmA (M78 family)/DNA-binding XRE family transcriptional regulator
VIYGVRIRQVRELLCLTQDDLARSTEVSQGWVAQVESGQRQPTETWVTALSTATGFPAGFFRRNPDDSFPLGSLLFRAQAAMTQSERKIAHRSGQIGFDAFDLLVRRFPAVPPRLPMQDVDSTPATAAELTRACLGLSPDVPIKRLMRESEQAGVVMLWLTLDSRHHDAYSLWAGRRPERPVIVGLGDMSGCRQRFSVAHELGHLVLHRAPHAEVEQEAHLFARELLLPRAGVEDDLPRRVTLSALAPLKARWGVSLGTLIRRALDLDRITERQYRYLNQQISANGWRAVGAHEPGDESVPFERPRALAKMLETLYGPGIDVVSAARDLAIPVNIMQDLLSWQERRQADPRPLGIAEVVDLRDRRRIGNRR